MSLLSSIFDETFPKATPYLLQIAAITGFIQIWVNFTLLYSFMETRFWCSMLYLFVVVTSVVAVNLYIAINKRLVNVAGVLLGSFTIPTIFMSFLLVSAYLNGLPVWIPPFPTVPFETMYIVITACIVILGISALVYFKPDLLEKLLHERQGQQHSSRLPKPSISPMDDVSRKEKGKERR
ncbi:MAG: hypothetical protein QXF75_03905 [Candidatus Bathyarchaeia archaeon]